MTRAYYPKDVTKFSRHVKDGLKAIDQKLRGISLLGGWAVYELVEPEHAMESQDIDILVHNQASWNEAIPFLEQNGYSWRWITTKDGQLRDHCMEHEFHEQMVADIFYANNIGDDFVRKLFSTAWMTGFKDHPYEGFVPSVKTTLYDKLETLPKRANREKALKDALDARALLLHNRQGIGARDLLPQVSAVARAAVPHVKKLRENPGPFATELDDIIALLARS